MPAPAPALDPFGAAFNAFAGPLGKGLGEAIGGGGPFMGGSSTATYGSSMFDNSNWTVNVGSGSASATNANAKSQEATRASDAFAGGIGLSSAPMQAGMNPLLLLVIGSVAVGLIVRRKGR
jgi:hypothetical protein